MKKLFLTALAVVSALGLSAQRASDSSEFSFWDTDEVEQSIVIGPRVGLNVSTYSVDKIDDSDLGSKVGFSAGLAVEFPIVRSFYINTGLFYTVKGAKEEVTEDGYTAKTTMTAGYLELPVYASYRLNFAEESQLQINFGTYFAYGLNGKMKYEDNEGNTDIDLFGVSDEDDYKAGLKRFDFGLGVGLGYTFHKVYLGMNYQFGLVNIADKKEWENASIKNSNFNISLGYNF